jgi:predicted DsbA family dithiol-disulfide isomerase
LEELFAGQPLDIPGMLANLGKVANDLGLPFGERTMTYNSRLAQELGKWAEEKALGDAFHHAAFLAYFRDGKNIARHDVLIEISEGIGLDKDNAASVLKNRTFKEPVDRDWEKSRQMEIKAVPTFVFAGQRLVGAQPYGALERLVRSNPINLSLPA